MKNYIGFIFNDQNNYLRKKTIGLCTILIGFTLFIGLWTFYALHHSPLLLSTAGLAYLLGLRHAVDADHIAAIDGVTRKLMQENKKPISIGFFFSLGHSTIVIIATICVAFMTSRLMSPDLAEWRSIANILCTSISALFLLFIAIVNLFIFVSLCKGSPSPAPTGVNFVAKYCQRIFKLVTKSWHMYFVGFILGLSFDTATEIALLGIAASQVLNGVSIWTILIFPALFLAAMTLIDTLNCIIMIHAYGWAFIKPARKRHYNLTITLISVVVALFVGGTEILGLFSNQTQDWDFSYLGYWIIFLFISSWGISVVVQRMREK